MSAENEISIDLVSDTRPLDLIGNQNTSRDARDPLNSEPAKGSTETVSSNPTIIDLPTSFNVGEMVNQNPPPLPQLEFFAGAQPNSISDEVRSLVLDVLKNVSINGVYPQVSGGSIDFQLDTPRESASEKWDYVNSAANQITFEQSRTQDSIPNTQPNNSVQAFEIQSPTLQLSRQEIQRVNMSDGDVRAILDVARDNGTLVRVPPQGSNNTQPNQQRDANGVNPSVGEPNNRTQQPTNNNQQAPQNTPQNGTNAQALNQPAQTAQQNQPQQVGMPVADTNPNVANPNARPVGDRDSDTANPNARPLRDRDSDTANTKAKPVSNDREIMASRLTPSAAPVEAAKEGVQTIPVLMRRADLKQPMIAYIFGKGYENVSESENNKLFNSISGTQASYGTEEYWYPDVFPPIPSDSNVYILGVVGGSSPNLFWAKTDTCSQ